MPLDARALASEWLSPFASALSAGDINAVTKSLLPDGWLRDVLVFTWDLRSLEGHDKIASYLVDTLANACITDVILNDAADFAPQVFTWPQLQATGVELAFTFECRHGHGRGFARLLRDADGVFKAYTLLAELADLVGHEELGTLRFRDDLAGRAEGARPIPIEQLHDAFAKWTAEVETNPYALIVGAGQTGLQVAARFKQMNITSLVIERNSRIGDSWRKRYSTLVLHTTRRHTTLLYQPFPSNWPDFAPACKLADWLEYYASVQDLTVWMKTQFKQSPTYDSKLRRWNVTVIRDGVEVDLHPAHIILATGTAGRPFTPDIPSIDRFRGELLHSGDFPGGAAYTGKRVAIIGAGNSSIDVCQDLVLHNAKSVTVVQRSTTCVVWREYQRQVLHEAFPDAAPQELTDLKSLGLPNMVLRRLAIAASPQGFEINSEIHQKFRKAGFNVDLGPEGQGLYTLYLERAGGYWTDKGITADMAEGGKIVPRHGVPERFTEDSLVLNDGSEIPADVVIFATGYTRIREANKEVFGEDVISQTEEVFGLDEEGEIKGSYRPCGHPGLWFATGDFGHARYMSKPLALQIKAIQLGLLEHSGRRIGVTNGDAVPGS